MSKIDTKYFDSLGLKAEDKVTGFKGVTTSLSYDLYGCIQFLITPFADKDGKYGESCWLDISRINISEERVMEVPDYSNAYIGGGNKGAADKPMPTS